MEEALDLSSDSTLNNNNNNEPVEYHVRAFSFVRSVGVFVIIIKTVGINNVVRSTARSPLRNCSL